MFFEAKTSIHLVLPQQQRSSIPQLISLKSGEASPKILPKTPHGTVADLRRVAEEVVALAVVGANEPEALVVPGDTHTGLARAALAAELASLGRAAGVARAGAARAARRGARARARLFSARAAIGHLLCCAAG